jgi:hypothetical protein
VKSLALILSITGLLGLSIALGWGGICMAVPLAVAAGLATLSLRRRSRIMLRRNYEAGRCLKCGYDVRTNLTHCSECGDELIPQVQRYYDDLLTPL